MKKNVTILVACLMAITFRSMPAYSQDMKYCGTTEMQLKLFEQHPELWEAQQAYDAQIREQISSSSATRDEEQVYIIPIVFHVIHNYGQEYISDEQIEDQVRILNEDYRKLNPDTAAIVNEFIGIAADAKIEFRLAKKTTGGGCTTGIDRIKSHETFEGNDGSKLSQWPRSMYLNVWTVSKMADGVAGYAYSPSAVQGFGAPYDGIMILNDYIGSIGSSTPYTSRALTHEIGHYLNLPHTWGGTNLPGVECGDDGVFDTPLTEGWTTCNLNGAVCTPGVIENVQNYMEYAYCSNMFTAGQVAVMRGVLNLPVSDRNKLWQESNLIATGTNDGYVAEECAPRADFNPNFYNICQGSDIIFNDFSWSGETTNWSWDFPGGTPSSSTEQNPTVIFNEPGTHTITLTASNATGSSTVSKDVYVSAPTAQYAHYYYENFEVQSVFDNDWIIGNTDNNESEWDIVSNAGYNSSGSVRIDNFNSDEGDVDYLISPSLDLSGMSVINLSFRFAGASASADIDFINDQLRILSSTNCGESWFIRNVRDGLDLINNGAWGTYFTPEGNSTTWSLATIALPISSVAQPNVRFKFEFTGGSLGNNFYIDDITISEYAVGINTPGGEAIALNIFPNPNNGDFMLTYNLEAQSNVRVTIVDITGREILEVLQENQSAGNHQQSIHAAELKDIATGIYMLRLQTDNGTFNKKLVIE